ncbi:DNA cytosine methyltransferase [Aurantimonas endophytica]|uniref:DNA (cytosine-5-)-methyltransferase n=1 Tax=Aurantimonas endophytica TaxID=1522175 RepID=A0A7W6HI81_9HYPH|nr:DNA cytosine methyltransferase [Aurantimonas endophytica]MBB4005677.1 DNA (cytosine-5)-methyltransferase 1 [Aurantimonas endophytica]MCO6406373.1 DNA (cytosine-5-)-methyltransferase [Aurantimonas endophytica]
MSASNAPASVVDIFCGAGGLSYGFLDEGFSVVAGIDVDEGCRHPYTKNLGAPFLRRDVAEIEAKEICDLFVPNLPRVLVGCAPCQPFSSYNQKNDDPKWQLLREFARLIVDIQPDIVSMENVPRLLTFKGGLVFQEFVRTLRAAGYEVNFDILYGPDFGMAQSRSRLVLLAAKGVGPELPMPTHKDGYRTVADEIADLSPLGAGEVDPTDRLHRTSKLSEVNLQRIRASKPGGTWRDWPRDLIAGCHQEERGRGYSSVYGRMVLDKPSPTITTQFYGFGNGRFGHPIQDRALSLREGAMLQGFPRDYSFLPDETEVSFKTIGRMIGNAVPVQLARAIARAVQKHLAGN